jgi:hypothetical protein
VEKRMKYKIEFQYKPKQSARPIDAVQPEDISSETGEYIPIPGVGDTVACKIRGGMEAFKVLTRHFSYFESADGKISWCCVNIVVTDVEKGEMAERLKE